MKYERVAAVVTWTYAAGFGIATVPVAVYLNQRGTLPWFADLFPMYGGPWSSRLDIDTFTTVLVVFLIVTIMTAWTGWLLWRGSVRGALANLALLPFERCSGSGSHFRSRSWSGSPGPPSSPPSWSLVNGGRRWPPTDVSARAAEYRTEWFLGWQRERPFLPSSVKVRRAQAQLTNRG